MSRSTQKSRLWRGFALLALALTVVLAVVATTMASDNGRVAGRGAPNNAQLAVYSTTSVRDAGLMQNVVIPWYNAAHPGVTIKTVYVGSGAAIQAARDGLADVLIVHSPTDEKQLLTDGVATLRLPFAYNYFTVVGPRTTPPASRPRRRLPRPSAASPAGAGLSPAAESPSSPAATPPARTRRSSSSGTPPE